MRFAYFDISTYFSLLNSIYFQLSGTTAARTLLDTRLLYCPNVSVIYTGKVANISWKNILDMNPIGGIAAESKGRKRTH